MTIGNNVLELIGIAGTRGWTVKQLVEFAELMFEKDLADCSDREIAAMKSHFLGMEAK